MTANLPMGGFLINNLGTPVSSTDACTKGYVDTNAITTTSLGSGVLTFLTTPTSANLAAALTDETGTGANVFGTSPTITTPTVSGLNLSAGTTSVAPINLNSGTNLTTAAAGKVEYDGKVAYLTPQGTQRGVLPGEQFYRLNSDLAGANSTSAQSVFGVGVTLSSSTVYKFEINLIFAKSAGTTSHSFSLLYGGTATLNNIMIQGANNIQASAYTPAGGSLNFGFYTTNVATALAITSGIASAAYSIQSYATGTVSINSGGTFIPQYILSVAPGGAYSTLVGSYMLIYPVSASGANTSVGAWA